MKRALLTSLIVSLLGIGALAQSKAPVQNDEPTIILTGAVYDINGAVIINGTRIEASGTARKSYEATTDDEGIYQFKLPLGVYDITVSAPGFCPSRMEDFIVVNSTHGKMTLDFVLEVARTGERCKHAMVIENKSKRKARKNPPASTK